MSPELAHVSLPLASPQKSPIKYDFLQKKSLGVQPLKKKSYSFEDFKICIENVWLVLSEESQYVDYIKCLLIGK